MILPNKYENIKSNALVVGAKIVSLLLDVQEASIIDIQLFLKKHKCEITYQKLFDILTFLFIANLLDFNNNLIYIKNGTRTNIHNPETFI